MCDGLSSNLSEDFETLLGQVPRCTRDANTWKWPRAFPRRYASCWKHCARCIRCDARARKQCLIPSSGCNYIRTESEPLMEALEQWMQAQFAERMVEPNSGLGEAILHAKELGRLTLFLRVAGAPLDNNICERALKKAILHRRNALFYRTLNGARVG